MKKFGAIMAALLIFHGCSLNKSTQNSVKDADSEKEYFQPIKSVKELPRGTPYVEPPTVPPEGE